MGQVDITESETSVGLSPYARAVNKRSLAWLDAGKLSKWMNNDLVEVMTTYIGQGAKRAETTRRFGNGSIKLQTKVNQAFLLEVDKIVEDKYGVTNISDKVAKHMAALVDNKEPVDLTIQQYTALLINKHLGKKDAVSETDVDTIQTDAMTKLQGPIKDIMAMEGTIGYDINPKIQRLQGTVLVYQNIRTLGLSLFAQMIDPLGIMIRGGTMKEAFATYSRGLKEIKASWTGKKIEDRETAIAELIGTVDSAGFLSNFGQSYGSLYIHEKARRWNEGLFKYNGMDGFNRASRVQATQAAISFIKRQKTNPDSNTERYLKELVLDSSDIVIDDKGDLNYADPKIQVAIKRWVDQAILRPNAAQRPAWMSDPHFALFSHMKQFSYSFHDVILKRAWLEAKNNGNLSPIGILTMGFVPMMIAADAAKAILLTGNEPYWMKDLPSTINHGVNRAGLLGIAQPYADPVSNGHVFSIAGPATEQVVNIAFQPMEESLVDALPGASIVNTIRGPSPVAAN
jgi:hypothetical protein